MCTVVRKGILCDLIRSCSDDAHDYARIKRTHDLQFVLRLYITDWPSLLAQSEVCRSLLYHSFNNWVAQNKGYKSLIHAPCQFFRLYGYTPGL